MLYFDASALLKIVRTEPETFALRAYLHEHTGQKHVSSALVRAEVARTVRRAADADGVPDQRLVTLAQRAVNQLMLWRGSDDVLQATWDVPGRHLRALYAIHVATALRIHEQVSLSAFVTYDRWQADAAEAAGLTVASPRAEPAGVRKPDRA